MGRDRLRSTLCPFYFALDGLNCPLQNNNGHESDDRVRYCVVRKRWLHHLFESVLNRSIDLCEEWLCCAVLFESFNYQVGIIQLLFT